MIQPAPSDDLVPPHDLAAERAVIGSILINNAMFTAAAAVVRPADFYRLAHRTIFEAISDLMADGEPADLLTVTDRLTRTSQLDAVGGPAYIAATIDGIPRADEVAAYARLVADKARLRTLIGSLHAGLSAAYRHADSVEAIAASIDRAVNGVVDTSQSDDLFLDESDLDSITEPPMVIPGYMASGVSFIVGAPNCGKTTLAYTMAVSIAAGVPWLGIELLDSGPVVIVTGEGRAAAKARLRAAKISAGLDPSRAIGVTFVSRAVQMFQRDADFFKLRQKVKALGARAVFIDNFSLVMSGGDENAAADTTATISAARELDCPVVFIHHSNKSNGAERGSTAIRGACDVMAFLTDTDDQLTLTAEKVRDGKIPDPLALRLVEVPEAGPFGAATIKPARDVVRVSDTLSKAQRAALETLWASFGVSGATRKEIAAVMPPHIPERTRYAALGRLAATGWVREDGNRLVPIRQVPDEPLQSKSAAAMSLQSPLQSSLQARCNPTAIENRPKTGHCNPVAMPLQSSLQPTSDGSLEPVGRLQREAAEVRANGAGRVERF